MMKRAQHHSDSDRVSSLAALRLSMPMSLQFRREWIPLKLRALHYRYLNRAAAAATSHTEGALVLVADSLAAGQARLPASATGCQ
jgi:hypothetical protein